MNLGTASTWGKEPANPGPELATHWAPVAGDADALVAGCPLLILLLLEVLPHALLLKLVQPLQLLIAEKQLCAKGESWHKEVPDATRHPWELPSPAAIQAPSLSRGDSLLTTPSVYHPERGGNLQQSASHGATWLTF